LPIYEYLCPNDGKFEMTLPIREYDKKQRCPVCDEKIERVDSVPARRNPNYGIQR